MSHQFTYSAAVSALTMALFALSAALGAFGSEGQAQGETEAAPVAWQVLAN